MQIRSYIQRVLAGILLIVFALSSTPKRFLHNVFAKHIDSGNKRNDSTPYQFNLSGYNCDTDNQVAESAFDRDSYSFELPVFSYYSSYSIKNASFTSVPGIYSLLRGPPVNV
ncbi:MAG TPA: hypothetical protein VMY77_16715 [Chitinophagaceae bacterium]|nr:hypothetical protein [Chitinophagaceae bacterium]